MRARFVKKEPVNATVTSFYFEPLQPIHYIAGQFTELHLPHESPDDRKDKRWFTLSSAPSDPLLSITTRLNNDGSSFKKQLLALEPNAQVSLSAPMGDFVLPKLPDIPLIFVAIGIGITPYKSIISDLQANNQKRDIQLFHSVRSDNDVLFKDSFEQLGDKYQVVADTKLSGQYIIDTTQPTANHYIYVAGPEHTVERIIAELEEGGIERRHIFTDFFQGY